MSNLIDHAKRELSAIGAFDKDGDFYGGMTGSAVMELVEVFAKQGHSGMSAGIVRSLFNKVADYKPLTPITGEDSEWGEPISREKVYQNKRCFSVFKDGKDGKPYYLYAIVWREEDHATFTGKVEDVSSRQFIRLPFTPKTFYVDVVKEILPEDWDEEPFVEGSETYNSAEYEKTGVKNWKKNKYRYKIKDRTQLEKVFEYYQK